MQNKSKQTICGIVCLVIFSCYLFGSEIFVYSFDYSGNIEIDFFIENASQQPTKQNPEKDNQQKPHKHIILSHLYSLIESETEIFLIPPSATAGIQPQTLSIQLSENLPNAHLLLYNQEFPHQVLSNLSSTIILV